MSATEEELKFAKSMEVDHVTYALLMSRYVHASLIMMAHVLFTLAFAVLVLLSISTLYF